MTRTQTFLAILAAVVVTWGCSKAPTGQSASSAQGKSLESRVAKLEQELKAAQAKAADLEEKFRTEQARGLAAEKERDELRAGLKARTAERDAVQAQYDGFRKSLKDLLGHAEAAQALPAVPVAPASQPATVNSLPDPKGL